LRREFKNFLAEGERKGKEPFRSEIEAESANYLEFGVRAGMVRRFCRVAGFDSAATVMLI
jgi:hypothetical protein